MGYYDENSQDQRYKEPKKPWKTVGVSLISGVIGGMAVLGAAPYIQPEQRAYYPAQEQVKSSGESQSLAANAEAVSSGGSIADIAENLTPAIVGVSNLRQSFNQTGQKENLEQGAGSGVIFKKEGDAAFIITNNHVIEGAQGIEVSLSSGEKTEAELVGKDPLTDLAVLKIDGSYVETVAKLGDSEKLRTGESVIAIGNPLGMEFSRTVTEGIISGKDRTVAINTSQGQWELNVIQTDAAINPGNSGGPLINMNGEVIGINSLKISQNGVEGLGFSIPSNDVQPIVEELLQKGEIHRPYIGVSLMDLSQISQQYRQSELALPDTVKEGVYIEGIVYQSPASKAGLQKEDIITAVNGEAVGSSSEFRRELYKNAIGEKIEMEVFRKGAKQTVPLVLEGHSQSNS
ncbi:PDZ domain-containing protein [Bacillus lacus]|uniref:PDZ domain-containing protein n=1 Tax=Metabacillus lacus TaxID=1983721 RepID=A0A7X2IYX6_9BACI|nr:trypsin-like peptidase domain-containing protein [Metabacillus lacus]MRX72057.1 PDZ domain-containing protein [Metabacillus lacus]